MGDSVDAWIVANTIPALFLYYKYRTINPKTPLLEAPIETETGFEVEWFR